MRDSDRARPRIEIEEISVRYMADGNEATGILTEVSLQGVFVRATHLPRAGAVIALQFQGPLGGLVDLRGEVRWSSEAQEQSQGFGVILHEPAREFRDFVSWALANSEKDEDEAKAL